MCAAGVHQGHHRKRQRGLAACGRHSADAALERRQPFLEHRHRGVRDAAVDMPGAFQVEQARRVVDVGKHVGRGLIDRRCTRAGYRIGMLAGMQRQRVELQVFGTDHLEAAFRERDDTAASRAGTGTARNLEYYSTAWNWHRSTRARTSRTAAQGAHSRWPRVRSFRIQHKQDRSVGGLGAVHLQQGGMKRGSEEIHVTVG